MAKCANLHCGATSIDRDSALKGLKVVERLDKCAINIQQYTTVDGLQDLLESLCKPLPPDNYNAPPAVWISSQAPGYRSLFSLMSATLQRTELDCTDPKDRIYALLGLIRREERRDFPVDCTKSYQELYIQSTEVVLCRDGPGTMLYVGLAYRNEEDEDNLPSWVRDWRCTCLRGEALFRFARSDEGSTLPWRCAGNSTIALVRQWAQRLKKSFQAQRPHAKTPNLLIGHRRIIALHDKITNTCRNIP